MAKRDESLPGLLLRARTLVTGRFRKVFREHGLSPEQWRVLHSLNLDDGLEATQLAQRVDVLPSSLSRILRDLEERGLLARAPGKTDARRTLVSSTKAGRALVAEVMGDVRIVYARIAQEAGRQEVDRLRAQLIALIDALDGAEDEDDAL